MDQPKYEFPDDDLINPLIDLYFENLNILMPLLHRPTFEKCVASGLHLQNPGFGATLLLVCAIAARYSDDPRVFLADANSEHSAGWKWFDQVQVVRRSMLAPPSLYDLQVYCVSKILMRNYWAILTCIVQLSVLFLQGSSAPQACWTMVGIGVRMAQDVGAHRRKMYTKGLTVDDELWKRAWW